jgi:hypothetical protein
MLMSATTLLVLLALGQDAPARPDEPVGTGPEPAPMTISWELKFDYLAPRRIESGGHVYWYMVYTVTNTSDRTQRFFPQFQLVTDGLRVLDTDVGIPAAVFNLIHERHKKTHPYLVHPTKAIGELRTGEDNARDSVAIWRADDVKVNNFTIYVAGLSGETRLVPNPAVRPVKPGEGADSPDKNAAGTAPDGAAAASGPAGSPPKHFTLRKTLELRYTLPGSLEALASAEPELRSARWVMR